MNPYVFIVGCSRSGTTLLQRLINAHSQIAITPESHWICRLFKQDRGLTQEGVVTPELIPLLLEDLNPGFVRLNIGQEELLKLLASDRPVHYAAFISGIFDVYGKAKGKELVGNKTPGFVRKIRTLHALWPQARVVHLVRDGRDVCLSMINRPLHNVNRGNSLGSALYYEMRYESLVAQAAEECAALCVFLGLPYQEVMLRFHEGRKRAAPPSDAKHAWLPSTEDESEFRLRPITAGLRDWRSQMPREDLEKFEAAAGGLLDELGYARAFQRLRPKRLEDASRIRESFVLNASRPVVEKVKTEASP